MKSSIALALALAICWTAIPVAAGDYRCDEDASICVNSMAQHLNKKGWVGIEIETEEDGGPMIVRKVMPNSPAEKFGFRAGDELLSFNNIDYSGKNRTELKKAYAKAAPGEEVTYVVARQGKEVELKIELAAVPSNLVASWIGQHMLNHHVDKSVGGAE